MDRGRPSPRAARAEPSVIPVFEHHVSPAWGPRRRDSECYVARMRSRVALPTGAVLPFLAALATAGAGPFGAGCTGDDPVLCGAECQSADAGGGNDGNDGAGFDIATGSSITLVQGSSFQLDITITRSAFDGPITIATSGLPDGVDAPSVVVLAGATSAKLTFATAPTAKQGTTPIAIGASNVDGSIRRDKQASLLVRGPAGALDTTFGSGGKVLMDVGTNGIALRAAIVQTDARVLAAGGSDNDFVAVRLGIDGAVDTSYGIGGKVSVDLQNGGIASMDIVEGIALGPGGEAVLAGYRSNGADSSYGLARITSAGKLDTTFDLDGYSTPSFVKPGANNQLAFGIALDPLGNPIIAGTVLQNGSALTDAVVARFKAMNGAPDDAFGIGAPTDPGFFYGHGIAAVTNDSCEAVTVAPDGKIVAACSSDDGGSHPVALRLEKNGQRDATFGPQNGFSPVPLPLATAHSIHVLPDGRVLMTGETADGKVFVVRFDTKGQLDSSFAPSGTITFDAGGAKLQGARSVLDGSGRLVFAAATALGDHDLVVLRTTSDGKLDPSFASTGFVVRPLGAATSADNTRIAQAPDGRIVVVTNLASAAPKLAAIRLWP